MTTRPSDKPNSRAEHLLEMLVAIAAEEAVRVAGVSPEVAGLIGDEVATRFSAEFGGDMLYIPQGRVFHTSRLYRQIWEGFSGSNQADLARQFGVSLQHVYRVIAKERERERAERQRQLPGLSDPQPVPSAPPAGK